MIIQLVLAVLVITAYIAMRCAANYWYDRKLKDTMNRRDLP